LSETAEIQTWLWKNSINKRDNHAHFAIFDVLKPLFAASSSQLKVARGNFQFWQFPGCPNTGTPL